MTPRLRELQLEVEDDAGREVRIGEVRVDPERLLVERERIVEAAIRHELPPLRDQLDRIDGLRRRRLCGRHQGKQDRGNCERSTS